MINVFEVHPGLTAEVHIDAIVLVSWLMKGFVGN
jgi:hypothetical protein